MPKGVTKITAFIIRRLLQTVVVLIVMAFGVFVSVYAIGDPVDMLIDPAATEAQRLEAMRNLGLDRPLWEQFARFIAGAAQGDLGQSFVYKIPAIELILLRLPATIELTVAALILAVGIGIPAGILAGLYPSAWFSRTIMSVSILGFSLPSFWIALMLIMIFAVALGWLPSTGRGDVVTVFGVDWSFLTIDGLRHLVLPALSLSLIPMALMIRMARAGMREVWLTEYVKFARAKGLSPIRVIGLHAFPNTLIPIITVLGLELGSLLAGSIVTEVVFAWPGIGRLVIQSIGVLDRPVIVAYMLITVSLFILINLVVDLLYAVIDPRVGYGDARK